MAERLVAGHDGAFGTGNVSLTSRLAFSSLCKTV